VADDARTELPDLRDEHDTRDAKNIEHTVPRGRPSGVPPIGSYTAVGDSFTEGVGDPGPGGYIGWADRLAALLADRHAEHAPPGSFRYANLAVRGRLLDRIVAEQVPRAVELAPDLVTFCAGGNDILRPSGDPDLLAERFEQAVAALRAVVPTVMVCTGFDTRGVPVLGLLRGKIATYNAHIRAVADRYDCPVLDLWSLRAMRDRRAWSEDRLHLSTEGHVRVALRAAQVLGLTPPADPDQPWPPQARPLRSQVRRDNIHWAREHLVPWIGRRLRGESSGDDVLPKRPELVPLELPGAVEA
jgi:lysophospholipase L1-like esterase